MIQLKYILLECMFAHSYMNALQVLWTPILPSYVSDNETLKIHGFATESRLKARSLFLCMSSE